MGTFYKIFWQQENLEGIISLCSVSQMLASSYKNSLSLLWNISQGRRLVEGSDHSCYFVLVSQLPEAFCQKNETKPSPEYSCFPKVNNFLMF